MENIGPILHADGHDICNYVARYGLASYQIQTVMKLDSRVDFGKLQRAVRLTVDAEPVLGCRFINSEPPYWKRLDNIDKTEFCSLNETSHLEEAIKKFLESPLDMDNDPMVKVKLIRSGQYDTIGIKINHTCSDGAGAKDYIKLLSDTYNNINNVDETFVPKTSTRTRNDSDRLFNTLGIKNPKATWNPLSGLTFTTWKFPWRHYKKSKTQFTICRFPIGSFDKIHSYAKSKGATINDLILAAFYRTMFEISKPLPGIPMDIPITIDLRRYLPDQKAEAIRNFSGGIPIRLAMKTHEPFERTVSRIVVETKRIKEGNAGVQNAISAKIIEKINFQQSCSYVNMLSKISDFMSMNLFFVDNRCLPGLSNLGLISKSIIKFGDSTVTDAYIVPPAISPPGFLLVACTYNDILTFSTGYYKGSLHPGDAEKILNKIKEELIEGCRQ